MGKSTKLDLLRKATDLNSYDLEAWYAWAALLGSDTTAINRLLTRMDSLLVSSDGEMSHQRELAANTDLSARNAGRRCQLFCGFSSAANFSLSRANLGTSQTCT
jgi:hypothetical protein